MAGNNETAVGWGFNSCAVSPFRKDVAPPRKELFAGNYHGSPEYHLGATTVQEEAVVIPDPEAAQNSLTAHAA